MYRDRFVEKPAGFLMCCMHCWENDLFSNRTRFGTFLKMANHNLKEHVTQPPLPIPGTAGTGAPPSEGAESGRAPRGRSSQGSVVLAAAGSRMPSTPVRGANASSSHHRSRSPRRSPDTPHRHIEANVIRSAIYEFETSVHQAVDLLRRRLGQ